MFEAWGGVTRRSTIDFLKAKVSGNRHGELVITETGNSPAIAGWPWCRQDEIGQRTNHSAFADRCRREGRCCNLDIPPPGPLPAPKCKKRGSERSVGIRVARMSLWTAEQTRIGRLQSWRVNDILIESMTGSDDWCRSKTNTVVQFRRGTRSFGSLQAARDLVTAPIRRCTPRIRRFSGNGNSNSIGFACTIRTMR